MRASPFLPGAVLRGALSVAIRFAVFIYSCYSFVLEFLCVNFFTHLSIRANVAMDQARTAALTTVALAGCPAGRDSGSRSARGAALRRYEGFGRNRQGVTIQQLSGRPDRAGRLSLI